MTDTRPPSRLVYRRPEARSSGPSGSSGSSGVGTAPRHRQGRPAGGQAITGGQAIMGARRWPRRVLIVANILVALTVIGVAGAYGYVHWRLGQIHTKHLSALTAPGTTGGGGGGSKNQPFTLLVVGSDSRAALSNAADNTQFGGAANVGGQRSDTIILVRVVPKSHQLMMLSIPRDLWGPIPGHGSNRINSAFDTGANLLIQTIQADLGVPINHYVEINFDTFRDISNAVGGVNFYFPTPAKDAYSLLNIPAAGCYTLKGDQALAFVRSRHYEYYENGYWHFEGQSDLARIQRQQSFIKKMIKKSEGEFTNPLALNSIIGGVTKNLTVDSGFGTGLMLSLVKDFRSTDAGSIPNLTLPTYSYVTAGGADVLGLQQPQAAQAIAAFKAFGSPAPKPASSHAPASTTTQPANTVPPVTVAAASVNIEVANGTGMSGQAGQVSQLLAGLGYHTGLTASPGYGNARTVVHYAPDSLTAARQVAAQIPGGATVLEDSTLSPSAYNLEVITGSSFATASTSASSTAAATTAAAAAAAGTGPTSGTSTTLPGTNAASYVLPGAPTGQPVPAC